MENNNGCMVMEDDRLNFVERKIKPSRWFYVLAVFMFILGVLLTALLVYKVFINPDIQRVIAPSNSDIQLSRTGNYMIYNEYHTIIDGNEFYSQKKLPKLKCNLYSKEKGDEIELINVEGDEHYNMGDRQGESLYEFSIKEPGIYHLSALYSNESEVSKVVLTIQKGLMDKIKVGFTGSVLITLFFCGSAYVMAIITYKKRKKAKANYEF